MANHVDGKRSRVLAWILDAMGRYGNLLQVYYM